MPRLILTLLLCLVACAPRGTITVYPSAKGVGHLQTVYIGTTRSPDRATGQPFGPERLGKTRYARLDVSVPPDRAPGTITWPRPGRTPDPRSDFVALRDIRYPDGGAFRADLARDIRSRPSAERRAAVFIHGFNNTFAEGAYRAAQIAEDLGARGVVVHYSWPSKGSPLGYAYDKDSALFARDGLEDLLNEIAGAGATHITLVAHSMGSAVLMETLRQMAIDGNRRVLSRIDGVALISPDVGLDLFRAQADKIGELPQPFFVFTSGRDKALALAAQLFRESNRLGNVTDVREVSDLPITIVDVSAFSTGAGHFTAVTSPTLIAILNNVRELDAAYSLDRAGQAGLLPGVVLSVENATKIVLSPVATLGETGP